MEILFVIHGGIDGYSRAIVYLVYSKYCASIFWGRSTRVWNPFKGSWWPGYGKINVDVARYMIINRGSDRGSLLLVGMFMISASKDWGQKLIESAQRYTRICLNFLRATELWTHWMNYTCWINASLHEFTSQWNYHGIRTVRPPNTLGNVVQWFTYYSWGINCQIGRRMELIMMVQWLIFKQTTMLCQNHTFSLQITNCRNYVVEWTLFLMMAIMELVTSWTLWQSFKVSMSSNDKDLSPTKVFWHFLWCKWE